MPSRKPLSGEVLINGTHAYSGVYPTIGEFGFNLDRMVPDGRDVSNLITSDGPHLNLTCVTYPLWINISPDDLKQGTHFRFQGPALGQLSMRHGYAAADMGPLAREVKSLELSIKLGEGGYRFEIKGETGSVVPGTSFCPIDDKEPLTFSAWFNFPHEALVTVVQNPRYASALATKYGHL
jgi:hypothetical protein